eukprot:72161-Amorphochlora_amoeboformis.AAC.3
MAQAIHRVIQSTRKNLGSVYVTSRKSGMSSGLRTTTLSLESSARLSSKDGFSVVAPMKTMRPDSMCGKNVSCCVLLKRWISSTNSSVEWCVRRRCPLALSMACRTSLAPAEAAESS